MGKFPILMYHRIRSEQCPVRDEEEARYAVSADAFTAQMEIISKLGLRGVSVRDFLAERGRGANANEVVVITFDDGNRSDYVHALPLLGKIGFSATFFVSTSRIGKDDGLSEAMIREMSDQGMEIGSHGMTHAFLTELGDAGLARECGESRAKLRSITGMEITAFAPPGGMIDSRVFSALEAHGYEVVCTSRFGLNGIDSPRFGLKRIPVTAGTDEGTFRAIVERSAWRLSRLYLYYYLRSSIRRVLGEGIYRNVRGALRK